MISRIQKYIHAITAWLQRLSQVWFSTGPSSVRATLNFNCGAFDDIKPAIGLLGEYPRMQRAGMLEISLTKDGTTHTGERAVNELLNCYYSHNYSLNVSRERTVEEDGNLKHATMSMHFKPTT